LGRQPHERVPLDQLFTPLDEPISVISDGIINHALSHDDDHNQAINQPKIVGPSHNLPTGTLG